MKSIGDLMKELGFNAQATESAQKAFIKNLVKAAEESKINPTPIYVGQPSVKVEKPSQQPLQLEFDFTTPDPDKKVG